MEPAINMHETCTERKRRAQKACTESAWSMHRMCMESARSINRAYMECKEKVHGSCMELAWSVHGLCIESVHARYTDNARNMHRARYIIILKYNFFCIHNISEQFFRPLCNSNTRKCLSLHPSSSGILT